MRIAILAAEPHGSGRGQVKESVEILSAAAEGGEGPHLNELPPGRPTAGC